MEANTKKQQLTYHKGITNSPSDYVCSDNELADEVGMIFNGAEHQPIQKFKDIETTWDGMRLLLVHSLKGGGENYILTDESKLYYASAYNTTPQTLKTISISKVTAIGNTLIVQNNAGLYYFLWSGTKYKDLGSKIPEPILRFNLATPISEDGKNYAQCITDVNTSGMLDGSPLVEFAIKDDKITEYSDAVVGGYSENKKNANKKNWFVNPFAVRYALELYDGTFMYASEPILLFTSYSQNSFARIYKVDEGDEQGLYLHTSVQELIFQIGHANTLYSEWKDIVKKIVIFASPQVDIYNTDIDQEISYAGITVVNNNESSVKRYSICTGYKSTGGILSGTDSNSIIRTFESEFTSNGFYTFYTLKKRNTDSIARLLGTNGSYFKIFEFSATFKENGWLSSINFMEDGILDVLTSQQRLPNDYHSHTQLLPTNSMVYNSRLHLIAPYRTFYKGGQTMIRYDDVQPSTQTYNIFTYLKTDSGERIIRHDLSTNERLDLFYFYPDARAYRVQIFINGNRIVDETLVSHPLLNGSYFFKYPTSLSMGTGTSASMPSENMEEEFFLNQIFTSEVNNPFVFKAEGNNTLDVQKIIGIATTTTALSQGQFGQYPMIVFTNDGIWAMQTNAEGVYTSIVPLSREVCNNPHSITQTDGAVFFSSEKGLMVVVGSEVKCVSEQLNGKYDKNITPLQDILKRSGLIAYDYRDSLLWILDDSTGTIYIYNIKAGTFARFLWQGELIYNVVNHYPDTLLQDEVGNVYSLLEKPNINSDESTYTATIETRPMKLENAFAFKSLRQLKNVFDSDGGTCTLAIQASNDMKNWTDVESLKGKGWKYFKFKYEFANMKATDRFAGTFLITQERYTEKLR